MKYSYLFLILLLLIFCHSSSADEVKEKTDGSFVGDGSIVSINSTFVGDISNSKVDDTWGKEDLAQKTDSSFVGMNGINDDGSLFAGSNFDRNVKEEKDAPFAEEKSPPKDNYGQ